MGDINAAYILLKFPCLTETFIAEEIQKIRGTGVQVYLFSMLYSKETLVHPVSQSLLPIVRYTPEFFHPDLWLAQIYYLRKCPAKYFHLLGTLLAQPTPVILFWLKRLVIFLKSIWIAKSLEMNHIQLIHTHFAWLPAAAGWVVSQLLGIPFTVSAHAYDIFSIKNDLLKLTTQNAAGVITISEFNKRTILAKNQDIDEKKISVVHCGIDLDYFQKLSNNTDSLGQPLQITSIGSLIEKKGHEYLIRACAELKELGFDFKCVIVGGGYLEQRFRTLIQTLGLEHHVVLAGIQSQVWVKERLFDSDIFVLACVQNEDKSGDRDGIPVSLMEALAMELPVISTPVSGIPELIRHEETGLLVPERDPRGIAQAVIRLVQDQPLRKRLARQGRKLVEDEFDIATNVSRLNRIFREVIEDYEMPDQAIKKLSGL